MFLDRLLSKTLNMIQITILKTSQILTQVVSQQSYDQGWVITTTLEMRE